MDKTQAYLETLATLRRDLTDQENRVQQLRDAIAVIERLVTPQAELFGAMRPSGALLRSTAVVNPMAPSLAHMSMIQAAEVVLRDAGRPLHIMEIINHMKRRGFPYHRDDDAFRASLTGSVERKDIFRREAPATYGLSIWSNGSHKESAATHEHGDGR
jgi:hypothetical protein